MLILWTFLWFTFAVMGLGRRGGEQLWLKTTFSSKLIGLNNEASESIKRTLKSVSHSGSIDRIGVFVTQQGSTRKYGCIGAVPNPGLLCSKLDL